MGKVPGRSRLSWARWALSGTLLAAAAVVVRAGVYLSLSSFSRDPRYVAGVLEGTGIDLGLALLVTVPALFGTVGGVISLVTSVVFLLLQSAGAHYHAVFHRLPARETLSYLKELSALASSVRAHAPLPLIAAEAILPAIACFVLARRWAPGVTARLVGARLAPLWLSAFLVSLLSLGRVALLADGGGQEYFGAVGPLLHLAMPEPVIVAPPAAPGPGTTAGAAHNLGLLSEVREGLATDNAGPPADPEFPFCAAPALRAPSAGHTKPRSAILLILESVDARSVELVVDGSPVMPNLRRLISDGVAFPHFYAAGHQSAHAMPALFAGLPAVPYHAILQHAPLLHVQGFPALLHESGYETAYFHGSDLSFEQQREFLRRVGFQRIVEPSPLSNVPRYGWGLPDGVLFGQLEDFVSAQRSAHPDVPYFAAAFTLSTHDPYELPREHRRRFKGDSEFVRFAESLSYLDEELGRFYDFYRAEEAPRGTLLAITGDHAPRVPFPGDPKETSTGEFEYRFGVPLVLVGLEPEQAARARTAAEGVGGHHDFPATLLDVLGLPPLACQQGRSLLGEVPKDRIVPSIAGEALEFLYAHQLDRRWMLSMRAARLSATDPANDPTFRHDLAPSDARAPGMMHFLRSYLALMGYAVDKDRFAPPEAPPRAVTALPRVRTPRFVAHRALTAGAASPAANTVAALERAVRDGAEWVEVDLNTTYDGVPVVYHDPEFQTADGRRVPLSKTTLSALRALPGGASVPTLEEILHRYGDRLGFCLELKPDEKVSDMLSLAGNTLRLLDALPKDRRIVIDSFDHMMLSTIQRFSRWPTGYDLPQKPVKHEWLDFARDRGFDWVYIRYEFVTPEVMREAHARGLRVMAYPPAKPEDLSALGDERPDGVMTEDLAAFAAWRS